MNETAKTLRVVCGANAEVFEECEGMTVTELQKKLATVMNITPDHKVIMVNGRQLERPDEYLLLGDEELEFKRPAGEKG